MTCRSRQVLHREFGAPAEVVEIHKVAEPKVERGQVLVSLEVAPINPAELLMFEGTYGYGPSVPQLPRLAGIEGVGRVIEGSLDYPAGTLVALLGGVWRDFFVLPEETLIVLPQDIPVEQLALGILNAQTALLLLEDFVELSAGDWLVQNAGNSAVGRVVDAIATLRGVRVVNVVRSKAAASELRESTLSAILIEDSDLPERVRDLTGRAGARLAIDAVGGQATNRLARSVAEEGTVVNYGLLSGEACAIDPALCIFHGVTLKGFWLPRSLGTRSPKERSAVVAETLELIQGGAFVIPVEATYPLDQVRSALEHAARTGRHGKVLLTR